MRASPPLLALVVAAACGEPPPAVAPAPPTPGQVASARATDDPGLQPSPYDPAAQLDAAADAQRLRAMAETRNFHLGTPQHATPTPDGKAVLFLRSAPREPRQSLYELDVATGAAREILSPAQLAKGPETLTPEERVQRERMRVRTTGFTSFELSEDGARVVLGLSGKLYVYDRAAAQGRELKTPPGAIDAHLSHDGARIAYVRDDDVRVVPLAGGAETTVTRGGSDHLTHGLAEFVAGEELDRHRGFWWSPDGTRILYEEADTTKVDVLTIADAAHPEVAPQRIAYPRPGRPNADVRFGVVPAAGGRTTWIEWDRARFPYVAQASWPKGGPPLLTVLDRTQHTEQLLSVDAATGKTTLLVEERDVAWVNVDPSVPRWLADGKGFLWSTERGGEWQLELRDATGKLVRELLPHGFGYERVADVDDKKRVAVVDASPDPTQMHAWLVPLDGAPSTSSEARSAPVLLAPAPKPLGRDGELASAHFAESHDVYVSHESTIAAMPRVVVRSVEGSVERVVPSAAEEPAGLPVVELAEAGPDAMRVAIVRPRGFHVGRKYAVIDAAYGGPHVDLVQRSALGFVRAQWMADATGAIVVAIDARGTPGRGREWERALYKKLGSMPLDGHVATLAALGAKYPEMDVSRVGVYGWSFGGYFAALAVLSRPDVYSVGVAGAPPADWRDYDTAYTERYLGLPEEDPAAYDAASLLTYARKPPAAGAGAPARPLLIIHGTADDNVWFVNGLKLADALEQGRRPFELMPLAGTTHMLLDAEQSVAVWTHAADVLRQALNDRASTQ
jgi:dipeptidyl-peptidase-4